MLGPRLQPQVHEDDLLINFWCTASGPPPPTDPNFANVVLLLGFEGADGSTTFTDESGTPKTQSGAGGNAQIDTAEFKYGSASGLFDGTGDNVYYPDDAVYTLGTADFTVEAWVKFNSLSGNQVLIAHQGSLAANRAWQWFFNAANQARFDMNNSIAVTFAWARTTGVWYHVALCRSGTNLRFFVDGVQTGSTYNIAATSIIDPSASLSIGSNSSPANYFNGWVDELRFTVGVARYTSNFTPPAAAFPRS